MNKTSSSRLHVDDGAEFVELVRPVLKVSRQNTRPLPVSAFDNALFLAGTPMAASTLTFPENIVAYRVHQGQGARVLMR